MVGVRRFRHPETGNMVLFYSLPSEEQKRIHDAWAAKRSEHKVRLTRPEEATVAQIGDRTITAQELGQALMKRWRGVRNEEAAKPPTVKIEE